MSLPFVLNPIALRRIQTRKNQKISTTEAILFKKGDRFQYLLDAEPVEVEAELNRVGFSCVIAPGDIFKITDIDNYSGAVEGRITLKKEKGTPGDQNICPMDALLSRIKIQKCELVKTEGGIPEGVNCEISLQNLFNKMEKIETEEQTEGLIEGFKSWLDS